MVPYSSIVLFVAAVAASGGAVAQSQPAAQPPAPGQAPAPGQGQPAAQPQPLQASSCEALRAQVETRIAASGVDRFTVTVVDAAASAPGRVVGTCDKGASKLMYVQQASAGGVRAAAGARRSETPVLTECRDGTVTMGDCRR